MKNTVTWEKVYIFVSSTFNDMHAERDYLIKRVFPAVRAFCGEHKLDLLDVDLRWGITEEDAAKNKRVVDICLSNLDRCRPFFIGLLGQRRGWIPGLQDINPDTLKKFPGLSRYLGRNSMTELELIHGILDPMNATEKVMRHAFLLRRDPSYLKDIQDPEILAVYYDRPAGEGDTPVLNQIISAAQRSSGGKSVSVCRYEADWDPDARTPELSGIGGRDLSAGRLMHFRLDGETLSDHLIRVLEEAIREEFPEHFADAAEETPADQEFARQEAALFHAADLYIPRPAEEQKIWDYFKRSENRPCLLTAAAGAGKTSLLAHVIREMQDELPEAPYHLFYRLCGSSTTSASADSTIESLCMEIVSAGLADEEDVAAHRHELLLHFPAFLENTRKEPIRIVMDAVDQWSGFAQDSLEWIPEKLPDHVRVLISMKIEGSEMQRGNLRQRGIREIPLLPFSKEEDKRRLIENFLAAFLKDINEEQIRQIIAMKGSSNPLFLKIILNELRLHGSFETLFSQLQKNYGSTPKEAFGQLINRLLREQFTDTGSSTALTALFLGMLSFAEEPLPFQEMPAVMKRTPELKNTMTDTQILDGLYIIARHLSDFLMIDGGSTAFRYDSFRQAFRERSNGKNQTLFNRLLFILYLNRSRRNGDPHYRDADRNCLVSLAFHGIRSGEKFMEAIFADPWYVRRLITEAGSLNAARWYREAQNVSAGECGYGRMAELLSRHAARFDIGANPVFYQILRDEPDLQIAELLYARSRKEMECPFYYPAAESAENGLVPEKEITLQVQDVFNQCDLYYYGDWMLQYRSYSDEITVVSRETGITLKKLKLRGAIQHCHQETDHLHVLYVTGPGERGCVETLHLPDFSSVFYREDHPVLPEGWSWSNLIVGAKGQFYERACKDGAYAENRLYHMNTGEAVITSAFSPKAEKFTGGLLTTEFCGSCMIEYYHSVNDAEDPRASSGYSSARQIRFWYIPERRLFFETEDRLFGKVTTDGRRLWYVSRDTDNRMRCRVWEEGPEGMTLLRDQTIRVPGMDLSAVGAYDGILCLFFDSGELSCYDRDLNLLGKNSGNEFVPTEAWYNSDYNQFLRLYKGQVTFVYKNRLCSFDRNAFESAGMDAKSSIFPAGKAYRSWQVMSRDGDLIMLSDVLKKIRLRDLSAGPETDTKIEAFRYDLENVHRIGYTDVIIGSVVTSDKYYIQAVSLSTMEPVLRYGLDVPEHVHFVVNCFVRDNCVGAVLLIECDDPRTDHVAAEYELQTCDLSSGITLVSSVRLPGRSASLESPFVFQDGTHTLIARLEIMEDADHRHISLYDVETGKETVLMRYKENLCFPLLGGDNNRPRMFRRGRELYLPLYIREDAGKNYEAVMYVWDIPTGALRTFPIHGGACKGLDEEKIYIFDGFTDHSIYVYSLQDGACLAVLHPRHEELCKCVIQKGDDYLAFFYNDILEVFDASTGEFRYSQYLGSEDIVDCPGTDYFYVGDGKNKHALFKLMEPDKMI